MKKIINYLFIAIIGFLVFNNSCNASTNTFTRTNENLRVPKDVVVDNNNYDVIMKTPSVNASEKVYDFAELIAPEDEVKLYEFIESYTKESGYDAVIVTTKNLNGFDVSKYTYSFYDYNDFNDDGVIFLLYLSEKEPVIYMGIIGKPDSEILPLYENRVNEIMRSLYENNISKGKYYEGCYNFVKVVKVLYEEKYPGGVRIDGDGNVVKAIPIFEVSIIAIALTFIIVIVSLKLAKPNIYYRDDIKEKINNNTVKIQNLYDKFIDAVTK